MQNQIIQNYLSQTLSSKKLENALADFALRV